MARIRTIKPDFWTDEKVVELSPWARLLFIGLWNFVDDEGRIPFSPKKLKMLIFPADSIDLSEILGEIRREKLVTIYSVDGTEYLQVSNFDKHQKVDKRSASKCPPPPDEKRGIPPNPAELPPVPPTEWNGSVMEKERELTTTTLNAHAHENNQGEKRNGPDLTGLSEIPESRHKWIVLFQRFGYDLTAITSNVTILIAFDNWCKAKVPLQVLIDLFNAVMERKGELPGSMNYFIPGVKQYIAERDNPRQQKSRNIARGAKPYDGSKNRNYELDATPPEEISWLPPLPDSEA